MAKKRKPTRGKSVKGVKRPSRSKASKAARKAASTRRLDKLGVFKTVREKTKVKKLNVLGFEYAGDVIDERIIQPVIDRANLEGKTLIRAVIQAHKEDDPSDTREFQTRVFPAYLKTYEGDTGRSRWAEIEDGTPLATAIMLEIAALLAAYGYVMDSVEFIITWA